MTKRFSASSAAQLMACPGSANLDLAIPGWQAPVPDPMAGAKGVGTNVHTVLEPIHDLAGWELGRRWKIASLYAELHYLKRRKIADDESVAIAWLVANGIAASSGSVYTSEVEWLQSLRDFAPKMLRFIAAAIDYMQDLLDTVDNEMESVHAEEQLTADWLPSKPGTTPDVTIVGKFRLEVVDYKSGAIPVSPAENDQLLFYAACKRHLAPEATHFTCHIVQPGNIESWTAPIEYLDKWMNLAIAADRRILNQDLTLRPSDHCTFCPANPHGRGDKGRPFCPVQLEKLYPPVIDELAIYELT